MKIKLFSSTDEVDVEQQVNLFIKDRTNEVTDIQFSTNSEEDEDMVYTVYNVMVIYQ